MLQLPLTRPTEGLRVLALGAHADDLEIGAGGLLRQLHEGGARIAAALFSATEERAEEARQSLESWLPGVRLTQCDLRESHFPAQLAELKQACAALREGHPVDLVLTHRLEDRHQDHRAVAEVTWQTFRDHVVLEYEIPKFEGDLGQPNVFVPLTLAELDAKVAHLEQAYPSQLGKSWYSAETFRAIARIRGIECNAPEGHAEAFTARKLQLNPRS